VNHWLSTYRATVANTSRSGMSCSVVLMSRAAYRRFSIYSLVYQKYRSFYSWIVTTLSGFVYAFGTWPVLAAARVSVLCDHVRERRVVVTVVCAQDLSSCSRSCSSTTD
jgi:hypothetical protein